MLALKSQAQSVIDPNDPVVEYDPAHPPTPPDYFHPIVKWVRTLNIQDSAVVKSYHNPAGWKDTAYKAYTYNGLAFRVRFPKTYNPTANDGKKYPVIIFFHGQGENDVTYKPPTPNYDNEWQLLQGPAVFDTAIRGGTYDGYVIAPQLQDPASGPKAVWYLGILNDIMNIVKYMITNNKVDRYHIMVNGLSEGGIACWDFLNNFPSYVASSTPMSAPVAFAYDSTTLSNSKYAPTWCSQGSIDTHPYPWETQMVADAMAKYGGSFKETIFQGSGHNTWDAFWQQPDFWPFINRSYSSNPWVVHGPKTVWPGQPFIDTIGLNTGFAAYQWRMNGVVIPTATSNTIAVTVPGTYDARVLRDSVWSDWSHLPAKVKTGYYEAENWVAMSGVQNENTTDSSTIGTFGNGQDVGYIDNGDWMDYTLNVYTPGTYTLLLRVAATVSGGTIQVRNSDSAVLATVSVPGTGGWQNWQTVSTTVTFTHAGVQNIRLKSVSTVNWNINWFQFVATSNSPLPVKFVYFNAQCNGSSVNLQWKTAQEQNTKDFSVQRSTDGANWTEIGKTPAAGQSAQERSYMFVDKTAGGSGMYRIVESDITGQQTISAIVRSSCSTSRETVSLYPNPSAQNSSLNLVLNRSERIDLRILDTRGAVLQQREILLPQGSSTIPLNMNIYPKGVYAVTVQYGGQLTTLKFIKN
ncbi:MAG: carbohydrate-binding protein [Flavisolibacter sp.]